MLFGTVFFSVKNLWYDADFKDIFCSTMFLSWLGIITSHFLSNFEILSINIVKFFSKMDPRTAMGQRSLVINRHKKDKVPAKLLKWFI